MTARFRRSIKCPDCGLEIPAEDEISQWIRSHPQLDSREGMVFMDKDLVCHRYKTSHGRDAQFLMFVEIKTRGAQPSKSQRDTMNIVGQMVRNTKNTYLTAENRPVRVYSTAAASEVTVRAMGYHLLRMDGSTPSDSTWIEWDRKRIDTDTLLKLLRFDLHPDTLNPLDLRSHHVKPAILPGLFEVDKINEAA